MARDRRSSTHTTPGRSLSQQFLHIRAAHVFESTYNVKEIKNSPILTVKAFIYPRTLDFPVEREVQTRTGRDESGQESKPYQVAMHMYNATTLAYIVGGRHRRVPQFSRRRAPPSFFFKSFDFPDTFLHKFQRRGSAPL